MEKSRRKISKRLLKKLRTWPKIITFGRQNEHRTRSKKQKKSGSDTDSKKAALWHPGGPKGAKNDDLGRYFGYILEVRQQK